MKMVYFVDVINIILMLILIKILNPLQEK